MRLTDPRAGEPFEPEAFLRSVRNVKPGLRARSKIVRALRSGGYTAMRIASTGGPSYRSTLNHLRSLEREGIATRSGPRPYKWSLTGAGQQGVQRFLGKVEG